MMRPRAVRCVSTLLRARIYEVFLLLCPYRGGAMRIIAFITDAGAVRDIVTHQCEPNSPPRLIKARVHRLREMRDQGATLDGDEPQPQSAPEYEFDQRS
jgi:hypothetical protein